MRILLKSNRLLVPILLFIGIGGFVGGISFVITPDGSGLGMTTVLLKHSSVDSYFWPGVFLLVFMCLWSFVNVYGLLAKKAWANNSLILLGITTIVWIVYETITIRTFSPLQPTIFISGLVLLLGGFSKQKTSNSLQ